MRELNYGIHSAAQIGGKHFKSFVRYRLESGIAGRTAANEMSHLRAVLKQVGKQGPARNPAYSNRSLGIPQGSRIGTKQPLSDAQIRAFQERMERLDRPNIGALLEEEWKRISTPEETPVPVAVRLTGLIGYEQH